MRRKLASLSHYKNKNQNDNFDTSHHFRHSIGFVKLPVQKCVLKSASPTFPLMTASRHNQTDLLFGLRKPLYCTEYFSLSCLPSRQFFIHPRDKQQCARPKPLYYSTALFPGISMREKISCCLIKKTLIPLTIASSLHPSSQQSFQHRT